jgi:dienelactone hydrolase
MVWAVAQRPYTHTHAEHRGGPCGCITQEWWGVTEIVKEQAAKLAAKGEFRCLIPDLYKGKIGASTREEATKQAVALRTLL